MDFLRENSGNIIVGIVVFGAIAFTVFRLVTRVGKGKTGCGCGCDGTSSRTQKKVAKKK
jgi:uncharacterized membrane protein